ncbi:flagellar export chaperone FliS [Anaerophilus nitritogenes]|uniref:flagellar export chaperone FliS n=1 Tax=Anaerophilus nitritogenes TaxID=2498136 RepID=UPI00101CA1F8|nr:flagellar export chaperone FliS [Anaerophilus nitritogenes]
MMLQNPYKQMNQYKENKVLMASSQELTLMLYDGVIKFINQAMIFIDEKNIQKSHDSIIRTSDIIIELNSTLDMKYEVSKGLRSLYDFILQRLVDANLKKDKKILEEILPLVTELRDTWKEAMNLAKTK